MTFMTVSKRAVSLAALALALALASPARGDDYAHPQLLISTEEMAEAVKTSKVRVVDASAPDLYNRAHIPGAVNVLHLDLAVLADRKKNGFPINQADAEKIIGAAGIDENTPVIVYDGGEGPNASGVWFALDFFGHKNVKVLNGGFRKWIKEQHPVTQDAPKVEAKKFTAKPSPAKVATLAWMKENYRDKNLVILDTRSFKEFIGEDVRPGASRGGHIPGAAHLEWVKFSGAVETFKPAGEIVKTLEKRGITKDSKVVVYCHSGIGRSTDVSLAMKLVGFENVMEYTGSWEEWSGDPSLPVEK